MKRPQDLMARAAGEATSERQEPAENRKATSKRSCATARISIKQNRRDPRKLAFRVTQTSSWVLSGSSARVSEPANLAVERWAML